MGLHPLPNDADGAQVDSRLDRSLTTGRLLFGLAHTA
jgi:hypothetical protein